MRDHRLGPALIGEALGTCILVLAGCGAIVLGRLSDAGVAAAFGLAVMVSVAALGHVSGAHLNPAVTAALALGRHFPVRRVAPYWGAQVVGAVAAAGMLELSLGEVGRAVTRPSGSEVQAFIWEAVLTGILVLVVVSVATDARAVGQAAAVAIGGTVALGSLVGGPISGASMNPARSVGPALVSGDVASLWVYLAAPMLGGACAALLYGRLRPGGTLSVRP